MQISHLSFQGEQDKETTAVQQTSDSSHRQTAHCILPLQLATLHVASVSTPATSECCLRGDRANTRIDFWPRLFRHQLLRFRFQPATPTCSFPRVWRFRFRFHFHSIPLDSHCGRAALMSWFLSRLENCSLRLGLKLQGEKSAVVWGG